MASGFRSPNSLEELDGLALAGAFALFSFCEDLVFDRSRLGAAFSEARTRSS